MVLQRRLTATLIALVLPTLSSAVVLAQGQPPAWPDQQQQYQQPGQYQQQQQYQQPQQYQPPQGYQQPGQYQQQPPPAQYQQPGQYQQPPPYYQPAPYPAGGGYPPPPPPPPPSGHRGLLVMGNMGIHSYVGDAADAFGPGFRIGGLLGFFVAPQLSLNGELMIDVMNLNADTFDAQAGYHGFHLELSFSPLFHLPSGPNMEFVVGPKLGGWKTTISDDYDYGYSYNGYLLGLNAGLYFRVGGLYWGGLFTFENNVVSELCDRFEGFDENCGVATGPAQKLISFTASILF